MSGPMNTYRVGFRQGHSGSGECVEKAVLVRAMTAEDAAFQALVEPKAHAAANAPFAYVYLLGVEPYEDGMRFDYDIRYDYTKPSRIPGYL